MGQEELSFDPSEPHPEPEYSKDEIYKKWYRTKTAQGFVTVSFVPAIGRVGVDIGEIEGSSLKGNTKVWVPTFSFATYLLALADGRGKFLYPGRQTANNPVPPETYEYYGGAVVDGKPTSRIFRSRYANEEDSSSFLWAGEHFGAKTSSTGAFIPQMTGGPSSRNVIRMNRAEIAEVSLRLCLAMNAWAAGNDKWVSDHMNPTRKK